MNNKNIKNISMVIAISYGIVSFVYTVIGLMGQHIYGTYTNVLILNNLFYWPDDITPIIISIIMIINLFASYVITCNVNAIIIEGMIRVNTEERYKRILVRFVTLIVTGIIGFFVKDKLSLLTAIIGCAGAVFGPSISMPFAMYLGMFWNEMNIFNKLFHFFLLIFVFGIAVIVAIQAIQAFILE